MPKIIAVVAFNWAHRGVEVQEFQPGEEIETEDADLIKVAADEGWATADGKAPRPKKPVKVAPDGKGDAGGGDGSGAADGASGNDGANGSDGAAAALQDGAPT